MHVSWAAYDNAKCTDNTCYILKVILILEYYTRIYKAKNSQVANTVES